MRWKAVGVTASTAAVAVVIVCGPGGACAMDRANEAYLAGDSERAVGLYEQAAGAWVPVETRGRAAERAGLLHLQSGDAVGAVRWLHVAAGLLPAGDRRRVASELALVYTSRFGDYRRAGETFRDAAADAVRSGDGEAARTLGIEAARAFGRAEAWDDATAAWDRVMPDLTDPADRAEGEAALLRGAQRAGGTTE